ncbi:SulP family inorganic anion transporter [Desulforegula conservatrix]|uniref:SulP family inorganic anion transporter n=1 Tax=Desulforegula conservatrix TaxID=153026 RepID=UPI00040404CC|nr:SulP family inorganic anion transporter [Desulforegula conservatrix]
MFALIEAHKAGLFKKNQIFNNIISGIIVGLVALPLAMAFAIASGAKPESGIYTAIIAGFTVSVFGGSRVQIAGPTGAFIVILSGITAKYGFAGLQVATIMAGIILVIMGVTKLGGLVGFIPYPVTLGFTAGIGVVIFFGQWKDFFGLQVSMAGLHHFHQKLWCLFQALPDMNIYTAFLGLAGLLLVLFTPIDIAKYLPSPLVSMLVVTLIQFVFKFPGVATIGSAFGGIPAGFPELSMPDFASVNILDLIGPALTVALLGALESLLSAVVADGMTGSKHGSNQELIGQGFANIVAPFLGGFAATGAIARTATNIKNGGSSPLAGIMHSVTLVLIVLFMAPLASYIPLCALSAILFVVAYNMSEIKHFIELSKNAPKNDVIILLITFLLTVFADLVIAVNVGVILAALLFMKRMSEAVKIECADNDPACNMIEEALLDEATNAIDAMGPMDEKVPQRGLHGIKRIKGLMVYSIDGPFFFGAVKRFERTMKALRTDIKVLIIRLEHMPFIDATGLLTFDKMLDLFRKKGIRVLICEANERVSLRLNQAHVLEHLGFENFFDSLDSAIKAADEEIAMRAAAEGGS